MAKRILVEKYSGGRRHTLYSSKHEVQCSNTLNHALFHRLFHIRLRVFHSLVQHRCCAADAYCCDKNTQKKRDQIAHGLAFREGRGS